MSLVATEHVQVSNPARRRFGPAKDVADQLGLPLTSLYEYARDKRIPGVARVGRRWIFDLDKLSTWLDAGGDLAAKSDE